MDSVDCRVCRVCRLREYRRESVQAYRADKEYMHSGTQVLENVGSSVEDIEHVGYKAVQRMDYKVYTQIVGDVDRSVWRGETAQVHREYRQYGLYSPQSM